MQPTIALPLDIRGISARFQAPALTVGHHHVAANATRQSDELICWEVQAGEVSCTMTCRRLQPSRWHIDVTLKNTGPAVEARVAYPYLFYHFTQDLPVRIFNPLFGGVLEATNCPFDLAYPGPASFCLTAAVGNEHALAVGVFDDEQRRMTIRHIPAHTDGSIRFVLERVLVGSGETLILPVQFIATGDDWSQAMAPYRDWFMQTFTRPRPRPAWFARGNFSETRQAHCLASVNPPEAIAGIWIFSDDGRPRPFAQLRDEVDIAIADGKAYGYTPLFYQFAWWRSMAELRGLFMFDSLCGDYTEAHETTKRVIDYIHRQGARTYLYTNAIAAGDESAVFQQHPEYFIRDAAGHAVYNSGYPMLMFCPGAPGLRDYWDATLETILRTLDADGLFLDQVAGGFPPQYCYDPDHSHAHPDVYGKDFCDLVTYIGDRARAIKADAFIGGELMLDSRSILLDETHGPNYTGPKSVPPATIDAQRTTPPAEYYIFTRYLCPAITSSVGGPAQMMDGAAGHHRNPLWRQYRHIFESTVTPCRVSPRGGLAYLFGPVDGAAILAVRAQGAIGPLEIRLPDGMQVTNPLTPGLAWTADGCLTCEGQTQPVYYPLTTLLR